MNPYATLYYNSIESLDDMCHWKVTSNRYWVNTQAGFFFNFLDDYFRLEKSLVLVLQDTPLQFDVVEPFKSKTIKSFM